MPLLCRSVPIGCVVCGDIAALRLLQPSPAALAGDLAAPRAWVESVCADAAAAALCGAVLWIVAAWLGVGLLTTALAVLPGTAGRLALRTARAVLPHAVYRLVAGAAGLGVLLVPVAAGARTPIVPTKPAPAVTGPVGPVLPAPSWPSADPAAKAHPDRPTVDPATTAAAQVIVRPGDSLWAIAANRLGAGATADEIATAWPAWYSTNRREIGADPALIRPGQVLRAPTDTKEIDR
jgi:hypothetical protein